MAIARQHSSGAREEWRQDGKVYRLSHRLVTRPVGMSRSPAPPIVLFGWKAARRPPVVGSRVAASKSTTPSKLPVVRTKALMIRRWASTSGVPWVGVLPRAEDDRRAKDPETAHAAAPDDLAHPGDHRIRPAAAAEIVDSF